MIEIVTATANDIVRTASGPAITGDYLAFLSITLAVILLIPNYLQIISARNLSSSLILAINILLTVFLGELALVALYYCLSNVPDISKFFILFPTFTIGVGILLVWIYWRKTTIRPNESKLLS